MTVKHGGRTARSIEIEIEYDFWALEEYLSATNRQLKALRKSTPVRAKGWLENQSLHSNGAVVAETRGLSRELTEVVYPSYFRWPFIVFVWAVTESHLTTMSEWIREQAALPIAMSHIRDRDITERAKVFFAVGGYKVDTGGMSWQRLKLIYDMRNCIVHANGILKRSNSVPRRRIENWAEQLDTLSISEGRIEVAHDFLTETHELLHEWLSELLSGLRERLEGV